jgi:hypothetical protein
VLSLTHYQSRIVNFQILKSSCTFGVFPFPFKSGMEGWRWRLDFRDSEGDVYIVYKDGWNGDS